MLAAMAKDSIIYNHDGMELPVDDWKHGEHSFVEFEQHGKDRAEYGSRLLKKLEEKVERKGLNVTLFQWARKFYNLYPQMADNLAPMNFIKDKGICATASHKSEGIKFIARKSATASHNFMTPGAILISRLSYSHIREIMAIDDPLARYFYEQECIKCTWSVRELRRQISTNLYVRAGISTNPEKMLSLPSMKGHDSNELQIREPFTFEFLGLRAQEVVTEQDIEDALITHLQEFILELGKGFCFESRQKRIVIDDEYYYPDLVNNYKVKPRLSFYSRGFSLLCHSNYNILRLFEFIKKS